MPLPQLHRVGTEPVYDYLDPLAEAPGGEAYQGDWIAATQPVGLPGRSQIQNGQRPDTDLLVLVQVSAGPPLRRSVSWDAGWHWMQRQHWPWWSWS